MEEIRSLQQIYWFTQEEEEEEVKPKRPKKKLKDVLRGWVVAGGLSCIYSVDDGLPSTEFDDMPKQTEIGLMLHCPSSMDCWDSFLIIFFESFWQSIWILISTCFTVLLEPFLCQNTVLDADFLHQKGWQYNFQKKNATPVTGTLKARQFPGGKCLYQRDKSHSIAKFNESPIKKK